MSNTWLTLHPDVQACLLPLCTLPAWLGGRAMLAACEASSPRKQPCSRPRRRVTPHTRRMAGAQRCRPAPLLPGDIGAEPRLRCTRLREGSRGWGTGRCWSSRSCGLYAVLAPRARWPPVWRICPAMALSSEDLPLPTAPTMATSSVRPKARLSGPRAVKTGFWLSSEAEAAKVWLHGL